VPRGERRVKPSGRLAVLLVAACLGAATAWAAVPASPPAGAGKDWPLFRGDVRLTGVSSLALREPLTPAWTFQAGAGIESTATISDGVVYVGGLDGVLYALDLASGAVRWKYEAGQPIKASPSVAHGTVYVGDDAGVFHAVDAAGGRRRWVFRTEAAIVSSATPVGDRVVFGSNDNTVYALAASDGAPAWKLATGSYVYATPAVLEEDGEISVVIAGCDGLLRVVRVRDGHQIKQVETGGYMGASPALRGMRAFVGTFENQFVAVDLRAGKVLWRYEHPERKFPFYASAALSGDQIIVGGRDKMVRALRQDDGREVWSHSLRGRVDASPLVAGERIVAASTAGELVMLDARTGKPVWQFDTGAGMTASPSLASNRLVISTTAGTVHAFGGK
jgi:outer membrane protein assembly factor BamB